MAFVMTAKSPPPREGYPVIVEGKNVGLVSSGTQSPSMRKGIGMSFIDMPHAKIGNEIEIEIRGRNFPAVLSKKPLYTKS